MTTDHQKLTDAESDLSLKVCRASGAKASLAYEFAVAAVKAFEAGDMRSGLACAELAGNFSRDAEWPSETRNAAIEADWPLRGAA